MASKKVNSELTITKNDNKYYLKLFIIGSIVIVIIGSIGIGLFYGLKDGKDERCRTNCPKNMTNQYLGHYCSDSKFGEYNESAISVDSEPCALVGKKILLIGGNAIEAIISVLLCMGVTIPESMGLGGGSLIIIYNATSGETKAIDARESAPSKSTEDMYNKTGFQNSKEGPLSIAVPGELAGYWHMFNNHKSGSIQWSKLFTGAIDLCQNGFNVSQHLSDALSQNREFIMKKKSLKDIYWNQNTNDVYKTGELLVQKNLGKTLGLLANSDDPKTLFYEHLSEDILNDIKNSSDEWDFQPIITVEDFKNYSIKERDAVISYNISPGLQNITLHTFPLPGSGNILSFILNVMKRYESLYPSGGESLLNSTLFYHRLTETYKFAFSQRMHLGDSDFDNCTEVLKNLTSNQFIDEVISKINDERTYEPEYYDPQTFSTLDHGTAHVAVVDSSGNAVSVTTTVNFYFGSKVMSSSTGILLNDEMDDFNTGQTNGFGIPPSDKNKIEPNKRPLSSMVPSIFTDDNGIRLVIGGSGGPKITTATSLVAIRHLWFGEDIKTAIDASRIHHQLFPNKIVYESCFPQNILSNLENKGHVLEQLADGERGAIIMAISSSNGKLYANSDYRKGGTVDGI